MIRLYHSAYNRYNIEHKELQANCIQGITVIFLKGCFRKGNLIAQVRQPEMLRCTPTDVILNFLMRLSCNSILKEWDFTTGLPLYLLPSWRWRGRNVYCCLHDRHALKKKKKKTVPCVKRVCCPSNEVTKSLGTKGAQQFYLLQRRNHLECFRYYFCIQEVGAYLLTLTKLHIQFSNLYRLSPRNKFLLPTNYHQDASKHKLSLLCNSRWFGRQEVWASATEMVERCDNQMTN